MLSREFQEIPSNPRESTEASRLMNAAACQASGCKFAPTTLSSFMLKRTRIEDVALAAGVSTATVSRALSHPERVSPQTLEKVQAQIARLRYVPDAAGRALASGRTKTIGCVIPTLDLAIFAKSTHAMQVSLAQSGYQLLVASHNYDLSMEVELIDALMHRGVDALVLVGAEHHAKAWAKIKAWDKPVLLTWSCDERLPSVGFDNQEIAALATRHLISLGHQRIGMLSGHTQSNDRARQRQEGFVSQMAKSGIVSQPHWICEQELSISGGRRGVRQLLEQELRPTALVCGNDLLAIGALLEAQEMGLEVPRDLSICGVDNHELAGEIKPGLTTVNLPTRDLGRIAASQILRILEGEPVPQKSILPCDLVQRESTSGPAWHTNPHH
jgi:LacI family transcriptional regulator